MLRILANDVDPPSSADYFAFSTHWLNTCSNFHTKYAYFNRYVILPFAGSYGVISNFTLSPGMIRIKCRRILPDK